MYKMSARERATIPDAYLRKIPGLPICYADYIIWGKGNGVSWATISRGWMLHWYHSSMPHSPP